jgi:hypothetical protein
MSSPNSSASSSSSSSRRKKPKKHRNDISQEHLDLIKAAISVAESAQNPAYLPTLSDPGKGALDPAVADCILLNADLAETVKAPAIANAIAALAEQTQTEARAKKSLMAVLRKIQSAARRKFADDAAKRNAYFMGDDQFGGARNELEVQAQSILNKAAVDNLPGITPAMLANGAELLAAWIEADDDQRWAKRKLASAYDEFGKLVAEIEDDMIEIRLAADSCWPYTNKANAVIRRAFGIPERRPYTAVPHGRKPCPPVSSPSAVSSSSYALLHLSSSSSAGFFSSGSSSSPVLIQSSGSSSRSSQSSSSRRSSSSSSFAIRSSSSSSRTPMTSSSSAGSM